MATVNTEAMKKALVDLRSSDLSIAQKYKKLNQFVREARQFDFKVVLALVQPADYFSRRIIIELAIAFRNLDHIVHLLKTEENEVLRNVLRKDSWLYSPDSRFTNPDYLINELLPVISFSCRQIFLTKIPIYLKKEEQCQKIFEAVGCKYGFENTGDLIVGCGPAYIVEAIKVRKLTLTNRQLKPLLKKHPKLVLDYLIEFYNSKTTYNKALYNNALQYIANTQPAILMSLIETSKNQHQFSFITLKLEPSNRFLRFGKAKILASPEIFTPILNVKGAYKQLTEDEFITLFASAWPKTIQDYQKNGDFQLSYYVIPTWLDFMKISKVKGEIIQKTHLLKYGASLLENEASIPTAIQKYLPANIRTKISETKILKAKEDGGVIGARQIGEFLAYKSIDKSIPEIKEMISHESDAGTRIELINYLLDTCEINEDLNALAEVCKYYVTRHRNENHEIHSRIIFKIADKFELSKFTLETWNAYIPVMQLFLVTEDDNAYYMWEWNKILEHLYVFQALNPQIAASNPQIDGLMMRLLKWKISINQGYGAGGWETKQIQKSGVSMKAFLELVMKQLEIVSTSKTSASGKAKKPAFVPHTFDENFILPILRCLEDWNQEIRSTATPELLSVKNFPFLQTRIDDILKNHREFPSIEGLVLLLMKDPVFKTERKTLQKYFEICPCEPMAIYFLRRDAEAIVKNWDEVQISFLTGTRRTERLKFVQLLKHHGYTALSKQFVDKCKAHLVDEEVSQQEKENAIIIMSVLQETQDFLNSVASYFPTKSAVDPEDQNDSSIVTIRKRIAACLKNVEYASDGFPSLLKFCTGDYLKFSVGSLYSLSSKGEQIKALEFLQELSRRPVSVKKHAIRLICLISSAQDVAKLLKALCDTEKNASIRLVILTNLFNISDENTWPVLKSIILGLGEKETDSLSVTTNQYNVSRIPTKFLEEYFNMLWKLFQYLDVKDRCQPGLVNAIGQNQHRISESFTKDFIKTHLFSPELPVSVKNSVTSLFAEYLLASPSSSIDANMEILQQGLEKVSTPNWNVFRNGVQGFLRNHELLASFISMLGSELNSEENKDKPFPKELFQKLLNLEFFTQNPIQTFDQYLSLQLLVITKIAKQNKDFFTAGKEVAALMDTYIGKYGKEIFTMFTFIWKDYFMSGELQESAGAADAVDSISGLLADDTGANSKEKKLLALKMLPSNPAIKKGSEAESKFKRIVEDLFNSNDPLLQVHVYQWIQKSGRSTDAADDWNEVFRGNN